MKQCCSKLLPQLVDLIIALRAAGNEIDDIFKELASLQKWNLEQSK